MSLSKREQVLDRIFAILETVPGVSSVVRNRGMLQQDARPAVYLLDGNEATRTLAQGRSRTSMPPVVVEMRPQIFVVLKTKLPNNDGIGEELNQWRGEIISRIAGDASLLTILGGNGGVSYLGAETDLNTGMPMEGQLQLNFLFTTVLNPYAN